MSLATMAHNRMAGNAQETRLILSALMAITLNRLDSMLAHDGQSVNYTDARHRVVDQGTFIQLTNMGVQLRGHKHTVTRRNAMVQLCGAS